MGSGKTTIGRRLAERLKIDFFDADHEIIDKTGVSIDHIFDVEGEIYRNEERLLGPAFNLVPGHPFMKYLAQDFDLMPPSLYFSSSTNQSASGHSCHDRRSGFGTHSAVPSLNVAS